MDAIAGQLTPDVLRRTLDAGQSSASIRSCFRYYRPPGIFRSISSRALHMSKHMIPIFIPYPTSFNRFSGIVAHRRHDVTSG
jgi:hypothetical protein